MNYGLQLSASGVMTSLYRLDVFANNLANMDTAGFKPDVPSVRERLPAAAEDHLAFMPSSKLLERLGGGSMLAPNRVSFAQGALRSTGGEFDLAIQGDGFFAVGGDGSAEGGGVRLTRDGRFTRSREGLLVTTADGLPVLDAADKPIHVPDAGPITIAGNGEIRQGGRPIARLQVTDVPDRARLWKDGHSRFTAPPEVLAQRSPAGGSVRQGHVEDASIDEVAALLDLTNAARDVEANLAMIQQHDRMLNLAVSTLARVA